MSTIRDFFGSGSGGYAASYLIKGFAQGGLTDSETLVFDIASFSYTLPQHLSGSDFKVEQAPTSGAVLLIKHNGTQVGSVALNQGVTSGTIVFDSEVTVSVGDTIEIEVQTAGDAANLAISVKGTI